MNYVVQANADELTQIAAAWTKQGEAIGELRQELIRVNDRLKQGWIGLGSEAYFAEMEQLVLPSLQRLAEAMGEGNHTTETVGEAFGEAEKEASGPFKDAEAAGGGAQPGVQMSSARDAARGAGAGGGQSLASRLQNAGFGGGAADLASRLGSGLGRLSSEPYSYTPYEPGARTPYTPSEYTPLEFARSEFGSGSGRGSGSGLGSGGGGSGGGGAGGGGGGSLAGSMRAMAGSGFGLSGMASGGAPELSFSGLGGFGGLGGPRPPDFGLPMAIAAISPFAALLGKAVKDRAQNG